MCCPSCSPLNQDVGSNFDKIAEIIQTRNRSQVRTFYNTEVKRINTVLAPLGVQVDPSDDEEVHTAMHSWHSMKDKLRALRTPMQLQYAILGNGKRTVAEGYGDGNPLAYLQQEIIKAEKLESWGK